MIQAGRLSRPLKDEFTQRDKDARKNGRKKAAAQDKQARNKTGIRSAREATVFIAPKMIALTAEQAKRAETVVAPRECYVCKEESTETQANATT